MGCFHILWNDDGVSVTFASGRQVCPGFMIIDLYIMELISKGGYSRVRDHVK